MFPIPEKEEGTINIGLMISYIKPEWIVIWSQRYNGRTYLTKANIYDVLVVQKATQHDILTLIAEYNLSATGKIRVLYKQYNEPAIMKYTNINKFPLPLLDVYLSHSDFG